jgi:hypothetical protein
MTTEKAFFEELARTPDLPPHLYNGIRRSISRRILLMRTFFSLAAMLFLSVGITALQGSFTGSSVAISPEVMSELQSISDYGNGTDIPNDLETYSFYEGDLTN